MLRLTTAAIASTPEERPADAGPVRTWHILTGEYPPEPGGVAGYTAAVAHALHRAGDTVHVWTSGTAGTVGGAVHVHRVFGDFSRHGLAAGGRLLDSAAGGGRLLVQWVPHAFARNGVNLRLPRWLYDRRARRGEEMDVMLHEPFLPMAGSAAQHAAAVAQRVMTAMLLRACSRAFVGTPAWTEFCRPLAPRAVYRWTPVPSGVPVSAPDRHTCRLAMGLPPGAPVVGSFGRGGPLQARALGQFARSLPERFKDVTLLLIGVGSDDLAGALAEAVRGRGVRIRPTGPLEPAALSRAIRSCDVMLQPYPDGVCTRHSSAAALLAHGAPTVTNAGRFTEPLWAEHGAVELIPGEDPARLASAVVRLLEDETYRARLDCAARHLYEARLDIRHTVAALRI